MSLNQLGLGFVFTAKDLASGVIERIGTAFGGLEDKADTATKKFVESQQQIRNAGIAFAVAGGAIIATAIGLAVQAGQFEGAIAAAGARSGATTEELERLRTAAFDVRVTLAGFSAEEAALTLRQLAEEGNDAANSITLLHPSLALANITSRGAAETAGFLSDTLGLFKLEAGDAALTVDKMAVAMRRFGIESAELEPAMKGAATGTRLVGASIDDMLLAIGLAKTALPEVGQATRAVNMAMLQLADPATAAKMQAAFGVAATQGGRMRPLADILAEVSDRTARMSGAARAAALESVFGGRAAGGLTVILDQLSSGVRDATGNMRTGAAAVSALREELAGASGTAKAMGDKVLDTFPGQLRILQKSMSTLATALGELFLPVLKPIVRAISAFVSQFAALIARIPAPVKKAIGGIILAIGGLLTLLGGFLVAKASIALFVVALKAAAVTIGGVLAAAGPVVLVIGALVLAVVALKRAWDKNLGGIQELVARVWGSVRLFFQAMVQLFRDGGFSGAVMEELNRAENSGIKQFAIRVWMILYRIKRFFEGIAEGFSAAIAAAQPVFDAFVGALRHLGEALGLVATDSANAAASIPSEAFAEFGRIIGWIAGILVDVFVATLTFVIETVASAIDALRRGLAFLQPIFDAVKTAVVLVGQELGKLGSTLGFTSSESGRAGGAMSVLATAAKVLGSIIGYVAAGIAGVIGLMVQIVVRRLAVIISVFRSIVGFIQGVIDIIAGIVTGQWARVWVGFKKVVGNVINILVQIVLGFVEVVASVIDSIAGLFGKDLGWSDSISALRNDISKALTGGVEEATVGVDVHRPAGANAAATATAANPATAAAEAQLAAFEGQALAPTGFSEMPPLTTHVTLNVDGEVLTRATSRVDRNNAVRSFTPVRGPE